ncbi:MAG: hypothetical protein M1319_06345 [Chloroflexi bacterium]|nr:hypothetical protein [Chloroflexota bacterium]
MTRLVSILAKYPAVWLFFFLFSLYFLFQSGELMSSDGEIMYQTTEQLALHNSIELQSNPGLPSIVPGVHGEYFSKYGLGQPLLSVLPYDAGRLFHKIFFPNANGRDLSHFLVSMLNAILTPLTAVVLFWFARRLFSSTRLAIVLALLYGICTSAWPYAKFYFSEPLYTLCLLGALYALYRVSSGGAWDPVARRVADDAPGTGGRRAGWLALAGLLAGYSVLTKVSGAVLLPVILAYGVYASLWSQGRGEANQKPWLQKAALKRLALDALYFAVPLAIVGIVLLWHNYARFGNIFDNGYTDETFSTPFLVGLYGLLFSSGKSLFLYSPVVILAPFAFGRFFAHRRAEAILFAAVAGATILYYSPWWAWYGGWNWGPRFMVPILPFLVLLAGAVLRIRWVAAFTALVLVPWSIFVQVLGAAVDFNVYINSVYSGNPANELKYLFYPSMSPVAGHFLYLLEGKAIAIESFKLAGRGFSPEFAAVAPWMAMLLGLGAAGALAVSYLPHNEGRAQERLVLETKPR